MEFEPYTIAKSSQMNIGTLSGLLTAQIVCNNDQLHREIEYGFASDLMSDVLTLDTDKVVLLTGLANIQAIRTAEMSDISCVVFVRNKKASAEMIRVAQESGIVLLEFTGTMFKAVSILSQAGIKPVY
ncbi:MAG: hypothetical protein Q7J34_00475 [Bacteroidales bacterium]|jgi:hypothetical protein|nr:hypothetical protein [Bacteroidales bacterium]